MARLTAATVKSLTKPGMHGDGDGLYLRVAYTGAKSWAFRATIDGKRRELGLGPYPAVPLSRARLHATELRLAVSNGRNPLAEKRTRSAVPTFRQAAERVHALHYPRWRSQKHADDWWATLERHAFPELGELPIDRIDRFAVLDVLTSIWTTTPETARRVRQRIRAVMRWAMAHGHVDDNPAGEAIDGALPAMPKVRAHLRALPYSEVPDALRLVAASRASLAARACFRFLVLTAARSGQARGATWVEIDRRAQEWRIPANRMKSNREHRVPLSRSVLEILDSVTPLRDASDLLFPSPARPRSPLSDMALTKLLRDIGLAERTTVHGFRSAFRDWAAERTSAPHAVMELSLAHSVGTAVEQAYARSDLLDRRRRLMNQWVAFVTDDAANIVGGRSDERKRT